ncbi:MAG: hypothetical protein KDC98_11930, partial [Planctomycetes bacterium]|nr:hypothetical protein [Planctomycetota bacterium]
YDEPVIALDIVATSLAVAGVAPPAERPLDGVDLLPHLLGENKAPPHEALFWRMGKNWAVREGQWKLVHQGDGAPLLFDLAADIGEEHDLAGAQAERVTAMQKRYDAWAAEMVETHWEQPKPKGRK